MAWIIVNKQTRALAWSNTYAWTDAVEDYDWFTEEERSRVSLPPDGEWIDVPWLPRAEA